MPYKSLWLFYEFFHKTRNPILLLKRAPFFSHLVLGIYVGTWIRTENLSINPVNTKYVQGKGYCELLVSLSMLYVKLFVHIREYDRSTQVGVEPVIWEPGGFAFKRVEVSFEGSL